MDNHSTDVKLTETEGQAPGRYPAGEAPHEPMTVRGVALSGLFLLTLGYTLYFARAVLIPITVAFFFYFLLSPVIKGLKKLYIPEILGAAIVILALSGLIGYAAYQLAEPTTAWLAKLPQSFRQLERKLRPIRQSVQEVSEATKQVEKMTQIEADPERASVKVEVQRQSLGQLMLNTTSSFAAGVVTMFILLYFLLATGRSLLLKLVKVLPRLHDKKAAVTIMHQIEHDTSIYLLTVTLINLGLGIATGLLLFMLGMPNPLLWGVVAGVLNFVPYVSAVITTTLLACVALFTFEQLGKILLVPTVYIVLNCLEGFVITPMVHSQRFTLNPVVIMIWLAFWSWIWGIAGTLLAMPMLITLKSLCDHVESLASLSEFLHG